MTYLLSFLFGGLAVFFLFTGVIPAIKNGDWVNVFGFSMLSVGAVMVANGIRSHFSNKK